jgi:hypothetical protein
VLLPTPPHPLAPMETPWNNCFRATRQPEKTTPAGVDCRGRNIEEHPERKFSLYDRTP